MVSRSIRPGLHILAVRCTDAASGVTQSDAVRLRAIALEITVQPPWRLATASASSGSKVIHAHVDIAGVHECIMERASIDTLADAMGSSAVMMRRCDLKRSGKWA
jgi:hypothetical protein